MKATGFEKEDLIAMTIDVVDATEVKRVNIHSDSIAELEMHSKMFVLIDISNPQEVNVKFGTAKGGKWTDRMEVESEVIQDILNVNVVPV